MQYNFPTELWDYIIKRTSHVPNLKSQISNQQNEKIKIDYEKILNDNLNKLTESEIFQVRHLDNYELQCYRSYNFILE